MTRESRLMNRLRMHASLSLQSTVGGVIEIQTAMLKTTSSCYSEIYCTCSSIFIKRVISLEIVMTNRISPPTVE